MVGVDPVGIAHNLLEWVCGHVSPEKFLSLLKMVLKHSCFFFPTNFVVMQGCINSNC